MQYNITHKIQTKFETLNISVVNNLFLERNIKERYEDIFSCAQRTYYGFCRLARIFKVKRALQYNMKTDLCMTPLTKFNSSIKINLYDDKNRTIYPFRLSDLLNIIQTSLSNSPDFTQGILPS